MRTINTKQELLDELETWNQTGELQLIEHLIAGYSEEDPDFKKALEDGIATQLISMLVDCYDAEGLNDWLANNSYDIFNNYRYANVDYLSDYESLEVMKENSSAFYNGEVDCLFYNEDTGAYVISW